MIIARCCSAAAAAAASALARQQLLRGMAAHAGAATAATASAQGPRVPARIVATWPLTPTVMGVRLAAEAPGLEFKAGQWVDFFAPGIREVGGFSIVTAPSRYAAPSPGGSGASSAGAGDASSSGGGDPRGTFELGVKASNHPVSQWLCSGKAEPGARVSVRVGGTFTLQPGASERGRPALFVAGGIGVTPIVSMLTELVDGWAAARRRSGSDSDSDGDDAAAAAAAVRPSAVLVYSSRTPEEFALLPRLLELQAESRGALQVRLHCSAYRRDHRRGGGGGEEGEQQQQQQQQQQGSGSGADGADDEDDGAPRRPPPVLLPGGARSLVRRRVQAADLQAAVDDMLLLAGGEGSGGSSGSNGVTCYVCGPPSLADDIVRALEADVRGVASVVCERWW